jgi:hypothetical protein
VKSVTYEAVQTANNCTLQNVHFGNMQNRFCLSFLNVVVEPTIKSQMQFVFGFGIGFCFALKCISQAQ